MSGRGWLRRGIAVAVVVPLVVVGAPAALVGVLSGGRLQTVAQVEPRDVALVLGAQVYPSGRPSPYLAGRLDRAAELFRAGTVKVILVSGDNGETHYDEPTAMRNYLIDAGIPADKVVADFAGFDTYDSCVRADRIFGVRKLVVVSQSYHVPRAVATCRLVGVDAVGVGDESVAKDRTWWYGRLRELGANIKMVADVVISRTPTLGARETSVSDALGR